MFLCITKFNCQLPFNPESSTNVAGTRFECLIERRAVRDWEWPGHIDSINGKVVEASVEIPVDVPVGQYELTAELVNLRTGEETTKNLTENEVVIIFNPWNKCESADRIMVFMTCLFT